MREIRKKSTAPLYAVALVWAVWAIFFPLYKLTHIILVIGVSVAFYRTARILFADKIIQVKEPVTTGNAQLDALIAEKDAALSEMHRLNDNIQDEKISKQIDQLEALTEKIIAHIVDNPEKLPRIRKFMNYYLPTTLKILNAYDRMGAAGVSGENIDGTMLKVENMMDTIVAAFTKQLDSLFGAEALDISTDITVLENMMAREGLTEQGFATAAAAEQKQAAKAGQDIELKL